MKPPKRKRPRKQKLQPLRDDDFDCWPGVKRKRVTKMDKLVAPLKLQCDRDWKNETPEQVVAIACNAMYWRGGPVREVLEAAIEWNDEYKRINNLCGGDPHWVTWTKAVLARPSQSNPMAVTKLERGK